MNEDIFEPGEVIRITVGRGSPNYSSPAMCQNFIDSMNKQSFRDRLSYQEGMGKAFEFAVSLRPETPVLMPLITLMADMSADGQHPGDLTRILMLLPRLAKSDATPGGDYNPARASEILLSGKLESATLKAFKTSEDRMERSALAAVAIAFLPDITPRALEVLAENFSNEPDLRKRNVLANALSESTSPSVQALGKQQLEQLDVDARTSPEGPLRQSIARSLAIAEWQEGTTVSLARVLEPMIVSAMLLDSTEPADLDLKRAAYMKGADPRVPGLAATALIGWAEVIEAERVQGFNPSQIGEGLMVLEEFNRIRQVLDDLALSDEGNFKPSAHDAKEISTRDKGMREAETKLRVQIAGDANDPSRLTISQRLLTLGQLVPHMGRATGVERDALAEVIRTTAAESAAKTFNPAAESLIENLAEDKSDNPAYRKLAHEVLRTTLTPLAVKNPDEARGWLRHFAFATEALHPAVLFEHHKFDRGPTALRAMARPFSGLMWALNIKIPDSIANRAELLREALATRPEPAGPAAGTTPAA